LGLFNPFDAFNQDLLSLDRLEEQVFPKEKLQQQSVPKVEDNDAMEEEPMEENVWSAIVTDDELSSLNIKDLNRKLKEKGLPKETIEKLKQRRRTLKNRKYATDCREKKDTEVQTLEVSKDAETESIDNLEKENDELREKLSKLKNHYVKLFDFAKKNNIELKPRNVPMGSLDSA
jgi:chromosome condensin MukBEF ATPase and DNA-binding subunit MukB